MSSCVNWAVQGFRGPRQKPLVRVARESGAGALDCGAMRSRRDLFPPIEPYRTGTLRLDARHTMYWEQSGNSRGVPVLFLHGGPGAGATPVHRRFFDPEYWRIVIFDQRGAGRSTPLGEIADNTPAHLVADIEHLRSLRIYKKATVRRWSQSGVETPGLAMLPAIRRYTSGKTSAHNNACVSG